MNGNSIAWRSLEWRLLAFFLVFTLTRPAVADIKDDWFADYIGAFATIVNGEDVELAIWQQRTRVEYQELNVSLRFVGVITLADGACAFWFNGSKQQPWRQERPEGLDWKTMDLVEYFGVSTRGLQSLISEEELVGRPAPPRTNAPYGQQTPWRVWNQEFEARRNACERKIGKNFTLFPTKDRDGILYSPWSFARRGDFSQTSELQPIVASDRLQDAIERFKSIHSKPSDIEILWPTEKTLAVFDDPARRGQLQRTSNSRCLQASLSARHSLASSGIDGLYVRLVDDSKVLVTTEQAPQKRGDPPLFARDFYRRGSDIPWEHAVPLLPDRATAATHCRAAQALSAISKALETAALKPVATEADDVPESFSVAGAFLVTQNGVGRIAPSRTKYIKGKDIYLVTREFGNKSDFSTGESTFRVVVDRFGYRLGLRAFLKDVVNDKLVEDFTGPYEWGSFRFDATRSRTYGVDVFEGDLQVYEQPTCITYFGFRDVGDCVESVQPGDRTTRLFVVREREAAIALFKKLSPDSSQWAKPKVAPPCADLPFCDDIKSDYLNAVFTQDAETIHAIEEEIMAKSNKIFNDLLSRLNASSEPIHLSVIPYLLDEYIYAAQNRPSRCFQPGSMPMTFSDYVAETSLVDWTGTKVWSAGGYSRSTTYKMVDRDFIKVCDKVCGVREATVIRTGINQLLNGSGYNEILSDMLRFVKTYECDSIEVETFEASLLAAYQTVTIPKDKTSRFRRSFY